MTKRAAIVATFLASLTAFAPCNAEEPSHQTPADRLFTMTDKLASSSNLSVAQIEEITGIKFHSRGPTPADRLFTMTDKLANSSNLSVSQIEGITGIKLHTHGPFQYISDESHDKSVLEMVEVMVGPNEPEYRQVSGLSLFLPKEGVVISRSQIEERYGKWPTEDYKKTLSKRLRQVWGCKKIRWLRYIRSDGGWNDFAFSWEKTKQLLSVRIITAPTTDY